MSDRSPASPSPHPPRAARWLLAQLLAPTVRDAILGDLAEQLARGVGEQAEHPDSARIARRRYWREVLHAPRTWSIPLTRNRHDAYHTRSGDHAMTLLVADIRFAFRTMSRRLGTTGVMIVTLALGIGGRSPDDARTSRPSRRALRLTCSPET